MPILAAILAVGGAFASKNTGFNVPASYIDTSTNPATCQSGNTAQSNCSTTNPGAQCTILASGSPLAWQEQTDEDPACTVPLFRP